MIGSINISSEALNRRPNQDVVIVLNRERPATLLVGLERIGALDAKGVQSALASVPFRDGYLSLTRAAHLGRV
ncbi:hypothetical protein [Thiocystis violacea]|uniref:hypothetical protein n=1 Tax=Thiocystis violacea TaxID=13725 RepID=UPI001903832A|nr:hypothetical protein [Thiocystis violacea]MBK1720050.1 hypothetical protein [Thiocystis violacea]